ncbi:hypothetical protein TWF102_001017 [Orbilia oligospora]|uniref:DUF1996 domain-containing protein n=1 Tax=Orbilia oligospora TaxID=2813651 RepID=A0A7C8J3A9_ORBOL|nr:hypothetical protein TWF102_001017 [Orbilia oligospora]KAF3083573.1 hypothetical protein TWF706_001185 [Orbilia oligospora]KAF3095079.1 hypothetical protein TWF103_010365 [Orbilia oligospora]KAF3132229.1 hypothetical protein TWF703_007347 [Orbilia oligospora]KAF3135141.1 hypothetical protein TWF594_008529 [Orbilia oligospora]
MKTSTFISLLASAASFSGVANAASKKPSRTFGTLSFGGGKELTRCRLDPIVNPGGVAGHMHSIFGGNAFTDLMPGDYASAHSTCTTANVKNDHSNYWVPSLYFKSPEDGTLYPVELFYAKVYYFFEATNDDIKPFPKGFRMRAGDPTLRHPPNPARNNLDSSKGPITPAQWTCPRDKPSTPLYPPESDGTKGVGVQDPSNGGQGWGFPDQECDGFASPLRADVHFPSCVNPDLDVEDWKNNSAYPSSNGQGGEDCPPGWIHVPHVFMEVYWNTLKFKDMWQKGTGKQPWVLSNGDTTGYSVHADFINGWDSATLAYLIDNCDPGHAGLASCPGLPGGETSEEEMKACKLTCPLSEGSSDNFGSPMANNKLFGNNPFSGYQVEAYAAPGSNSPAPAPVESEPAVKPESVVYTPKARPSTTLKAVVKPVNTPKPVSPPEYVPEGRNAHTEVVVRTRLHTVTQTIVVHGVAGPKTIAPRPRPAAQKKKNCTTRRPVRHYRHHKAGSY